MKKIIRFLLYLFIFLLPLQTRWIYESNFLQGYFWEYGSKSLYLTEFLLGIIIILLLFYFLKNRNRFVYSLSKIKNFSFHILPLFFLFLITCFLALNIDLAIFKLTWIVLAIALVATIVITKLKPKKISWVIILSAWLQSLLAIGQFLLQKIFASTWLGMSAQQPRLLGVSVIQTDAERILRAYGSLPHPNILAGFLVVALLATITLYFFTKNYRTKIFLIFIFSTTYLALLMTFSRAAIIAFFLTVLILFFQNLKYQKILFTTNIKKTFLAFFIIITVISTIFVLYNQQAVFTRLTGEKRLEVQANEQRLTGLRDAWQIFVTRPFTGVGWGNYSYALTQKYPNKPAYKYEPVHNIFILYLVETGICGLLLLILLMKFLLDAIGKKIIFWQFDQFSFLQISQVIALIFIGLVDHWLYSFYFGLMLSALIFSQNIKLTKSIIK